MMDSPVQRQDTVHSPFASKIAYTQIWNIVFSVSSPNPLCIFFTICPSVTGFLCIGIDATSRSLVIYYTRYQGVAPIIFCLFINYLFFY